MNVIDVWKYLKKYVEGYYININVVFGQNVNHSFFRTTILVEGIFVKFVLTQGNSSPNLYLLNS